VTSDASLETVSGRERSKERPPPSPDSADDQQTGLRALVAVARHLGLDWSLPRILHAHGQARELDAEQLAGAARRKA